MTTIEIAGRAIQRDPEGFLVDPGEWTPEIALEIARECGISELTARHWQVVEYMRAQYLETGVAPSIRALGKESGVPIKELYQLFPKGPRSSPRRSAGSRSPVAASREEEER